MGKNRRQLKEMAEAVASQDIVGYAPEWATEEVQPEPEMSIEEWEAQYGSLTDGDVQEAVLAEMIAEEEMAQEDPAAPAQEEPGPLGAVGFLENEGTEHIRAKEALEVDGPDCADYAEEQGWIEPEGVTILGENALEERDVHQAPKANDWYGGDRVQASRADHNFAVLTKAFEDRAPALFDYRAIDGAESKARLVLVVAPPTDYVLAYDLRKEALRRFKFDGVGHAVIVENYPVPPRQRPDSKFLVVPATTETQKRAFPQWLSEQAALKYAERGWQIV